MKPIIELLVYTAEDTRAKMPSVMFTKVWNVTTAWSVPLLEPRPNIKHLVCVSLGESTMSMSVVQVTFSTISSSMESIDVWAHVTTASTVRLETTLGLKQFVEHLVGARGDGATGDRDGGALRTAVVALMMKEEEEKEKRSTRVPPAAQVAVAAVMAEAAVAEAKLTNEIKRRCQLE
uniref:Uncharacterized protein n=1 Tax=Oryza punctata TaxID=4537 RepID=A0A0E0MCD3_ORYPU